MPPKPPTLLDIAQASGVSKATVSRALRNPPTTPPAQTQAIREMADKMGYVADPIWARLASRRWTDRPIDRGLTIAFLTIRNQKISPPNGNNLFLKHAVEAAQKLGYHVEQFPCKDLESQQHLTRIVKARGIAGIIIPQALDPAFFERIQFHSIPTLCCGLGFAQPPYPVIMPNVFNGMRMAWEKARELGYKKIGVALTRVGTSENDIYRIAADAYESSQTASAIPPFHGTFNDSEPLVKWAQKHEPDLIIGTDERIYRPLKQANYFDKKDRGFIAFAQLPGSKLSGVNLQFDKIGTEAVQLIHHKIVHSETLLSNRLSIMIEPLWRSGISTRK